MIEKLTLSNLINSEHFQFMEESVKATTIYPYIAEIFPKPVAFLKDSLDEENEAYLKSNWSDLPKEKQNAQNYRILRFREVNNAIKTAELSTVQATVETAEFLKKVMKLYGGATKILNLHSDSLSGVLTNLVEDFQEKYPEKVEAIGITQMVEELRVANEAYKNLSTQHTEEESERIKAQMLTARNKCDTNWRGLIDLVNWRYYYDKDEQLVPYMNFMNTLVARYRHYTGQKPAGGGSGSGEGGSEEIVMKAATFIFKSGSELKLWFEVDTPIIAPENTPGYRWDPEVPKLMPKRGKTFKEVAIEPEKFTALFHFADHREEEIREVVGAILHAPANTTGYIWVPSVPETMPAENTTYNEMPEEEQEGGEHEGMFKAEYFVGENLVATQWYHPGDRIVEPEGLLPEGWIWGNTPSVMPERDVKIYAVEDE